MIRKISSLIILTVLFLPFIQRSHLSAYESARQGREARLDSLITSAQDEHVQIHQLLNKTERFLRFVERERAEQWKFTNNLYKERMMWAAVFVVAVVLVLLISMWRMTRSLKQALASLATPQLTIEQDEETPSVSASESETETAPAQTAGQEFLPEPAEALQPITEPPAPQAVPIATAREEVLWIQRDEADAERSRPIIDALRRRGVRGLRVEMMSPEVVAEIEAGKFDVIACSYEPKTRDGVSIDREIHGITKALSISYSSTPVIIFHDIHRHKVSMWDQSAIESYAFALVETSRVGVVNQIVATLQRVGE